MMSRMATQLISILLVWFFSVSLSIGDDHGASLNYVLMSSEFLHLSYQSVFDYSCNS